MPKETTPAPPIAKATGNPESMPPKRQTNTIIKPISTPSRPNNITTVPNSQFLQLQLNLGADRGLYTCSRSIALHEVPETIA